MSRYSDSSCKVYVGDLPTNVQRADLEDVFSRYGYLRSVWVARNPPGFAFVEFDDSRDARDAVAELDGKRCSEIGGKSLKVELSSGRRRGGGRFGGGGRDSGGRDGGYGGRRPSFGGDRRQESCYACGARGHFARDCRFGRKPGDGTRSSRRRSHSRSRSRSPRSRSPRSRSPRSRSRSRSPKRHSRRSPTRSRSPSPKD